RIAFARGGAIWVLGLDGSGARRVVAGTNVSPSWSPDGTKLVFSRDWGRYIYDVFVVGADGTGLRRLTHGPGEKLYPAWSPDGTKIAFSRGPRAGKFSNLVVMNADGSKPMVVNSGVRAL